MTEKMYIIREKDLLDLLESHYQLVALECGGVDNWEWCGDSLNDYVRSYIEDNNIILDEEEREVFWFSAIAEKEVEHYRGYNF